MMHCVGVEFKKQEIYGHVQALETLLTDEVFYQGNNSMLLLLLLLCYYSHRMLVFLERFSRC
ncbi:hypothetical protein CY35_07G064100 [Sphagnum magellanicum]|uniref:Uncharacterized protein n=1 Tax=Sphagnum magellanicum TaxID=128215 RepID=A0ACB8HLE9_9BRYO|nr:hypothetical protein CY35_07G064100 [Sphagnum magellanicum]